MSAIVDRLDLSVPGKTELDVVREYLRINLSDEGTLAEAEFIATGNGVLAIYTTDNSPVLDGTLRLYVNGVLQTEGTDYTVVLATGTITFLAGHIPGVFPITCRYYYGADPVGADDTVLSSLLLAAKQTADQVINNPFEEDVVRVTLSAVVAGDAIGIDGNTFTAAAATDIPEREFGVGLTDTLTAVQLCACINSPVMDGDGGAYGVVGVIASNLGAIVTLARRSGRLTRIETASADASLLVEYVRTELDIPEPIATWVLQRITREYERRVEGSAVETTTGLGSVSWKDEDWALLRPYRFSPGL